MTKGHFCGSCAADLLPIDCNDDGIIVCPKCGEQSQADDGKRIAHRAAVKFANRAECCKVEANLSPRGEGVVKCNVCGARNLAAAP